MSKRSILIIIGIVLLGGGIGFGFWFYKNRTAPASGNGQTNSNQTPVGTDSSSGGGVDVQAMLNAANTTTTVPANITSIPSASVPQLAIAIGDKPQAPVYLYEGKTMTEQEYIKAWNASSTKQKKLETGKTPSSSPSADNDRDGITNNDELKLGTDPNNADTDGDGLTDGQEVNAYHTDPKNFDTDGDGLTDGDEVKIYHTDPLKADTDGDGFTDGQEVRSGYNPLGPGKLKK